MKKLLAAAIAALLAFSGPAWAQYIGPTSGGAPNVSLATGILPVGNGGAYVTDVSSQLVASSTYSSGNATANATAINNAINAASTGNINVIAITVPGTYYANQVVVNSNTCIELGNGVDYKKPPNTVASMFINEGALQSPPVSDSNICFFGQGTIDGNAANQSSFTRATNGSITPNTFLYGIQGEVAMINVNNFVFSLRNFYNCNGFGIQYIGNNALFNNTIVNTERVSRAE